jgi:hypothetical protein
MWSPRLTAVATGYGLTSAAIRSRPSYEASGVDLAAEQRSVDRAGFTFRPLNNDVLDQQQAVADRFRRSV